MLLWAALKSEEVPKAAFVRKRAGSALLCLVALPRLAQERYWQCLKHSGSAR